MNSPIIYSNKTIIETGQQNNLIEQPRTSKLKLPIQMVRIDLTKQLPGNIQPQHY